MAPLKKGANVMVTIARSRPSSPSGVMSPYLRAEQETNWEQPWPKVEVKRKARYETKRGCERARVSTRFALACAGRLAR